MTRVLVIDDDMSIRMAIETLLRRQDYVTVLADNGRRGVEIFEASHFDVVIVDIFMPGMDGLEVIKGFRARAPAVPLVAMSGFRFQNSGVAPAPDYLAMAARLGATYCLQKPFGPAQLKAALDACLGDKFRVDRTAPLRQGPPAPPDSAQQP